MSSALQMPFPAVLATQVRFLACSKCCSDDESFPQLHCHTKQEQTRHLQSTSGRSCAASNSLDTMSACMLPDTCSARLLFLLSSRTSAHRYTILQAAALHRSSCPTSPRPSPTVVCPSSRPGGERPHTPPAFQFCESTTWNQQRRLVTLQHARSMHCSVRLGALGQHQGRSATRPPQSQYELCLIECSS